MARPWHDEADLIVVGASVAGLAAAVIAADRGGRTPVGHSVARLHTPGERGGAGLIAELTRAATRHARIAVRPGTPAERLIRDGSGTVSGVGVRGDRRGASQALGGRVVLACGGF